MRQEGFIFVLMPFGDEFNDIYHFGIKQAANDSGYYCERVDEQVFEGSILSRIYNQIEKADIIVADLSRKNPNVFYETGYAHALNKSVILLTQNAEDISFDLKHYPHIIYNKNIKNLGEELIKKLNWFKNNQDKNRNDSSGFLEYYNKGVRISDYSVITFDIIIDKNPLASEIQAENIRFVLNIYNNGKKMVDNIREIGIVIDNVFHETRFGEESITDIVHLPDNKILIKFGGGELFFPQTWTTNTAHIGSGEQFMEKVENAEIRIFREDGVDSIPVKVKYNVINNNTLFNW